MIYSDSSRSFMIQDTPLDESDDSEAMRARIEFLEYELRYKEKCLKSAWRQIESLNDSQRIFDDFTPTIQKMAKTIGRYLKSNPAPVMLTRRLLRSPRKLLSRKVEPLRLLILSTPRSGNTWLNKLTSTAFDLNSGGMHRPFDFDWGEYPRRVSIQIHWPPDDLILRLIARHRFRPIVLARHPLDTLLSILHFASHDNETHFWLDRRHGNENSLIGIRPTDPAFLAYAVGPRFQELLGVSRQWWQNPQAIRVRYESLVDDTLCELMRIARELGQNLSIEEAEEAVAATSIDKLRPISKGNEHFWKGRPGHWKQLIPAEIALQIYDSLRDSFEVLGYDCDPDPELTHRQADLNWYRSIGVV
jgi:hypothetical protein